MKQRQYINDLADMSSARKLLQQQRMMCFVGSCVVHDMHALLQ